MGKIGKILLTFFFMTTIILFGGTTLLQSRGSILEVVRNSSISEIPQEIEAELTDNFKSRNNWININGLFQRMIGVTVIRDAGDIDVFRMSNGQLTYEYPDCDMTYAAEEVISLDRYVKEQGLDFMYVQLPCKAYTDEIMPPGTHTYGYADSDELISQLRARPIRLVMIKPICALRLPSAAPSKTHFTHSR